MLDIFSLAFGDPHLAVVPILIGPLQVLLAVLPAILAAVGGAIVNMFKPSALKASARVLWRNKIAVVLVVAGVFGVRELYKVVGSGMRGSAAPLAAGARDWTAMRGGPERRGWSGEGDDPSEARLVWAFDREAKTFYSSPALVGNRVYIASATLEVFSEQGVIFCLDADTGRPIWKYGPRNFRATYSSPSVLGKYLVCGEGLHLTKNARVTCLDAATGDLLWEHRTASHVESSPCLANGRAYIGAGDDGLYCIALEPSGGKPKILWHKEGKEYPDCETSPLVANDKVYLGLGNAGSAVVCFAADTGKELWKQAAPYPVFSSPVLVSNRLFVAMGNGDMVNTAEVLLQKRMDELKRENASAEKIAAERAKLRTAGEIWCLAADSGTVLWKRPLPDTVLGVVAAAEGRLFFGCRNGSFFCLTVDNEVVFERKMRESILTSAAVGKSHAYFTTENGRLYALDWTKNRLAWQQTIGQVGLFLSSPVVGRGHVYVGSPMGGFMCVGKPATEQVAEVWAGALGGPGASGWSEGNLLPERGSFLWRWPTNDAPAEAAPAVQQPVAVIEGSLYAGLDTPERRGLARLKLRPSQAPAAGATNAAVAAEWAAAPEWTEAWFLPLPRPVTDSVAGTEGTIFVADGRAGEAERQLHAVRASDGTRLWSVPVEAPASGLFTLSGDALYACLKREAVACVERKGAAAGKVRWQAALGAPAVGAPAVSADALLLRSARDVAAFDAATGALRWRVSLPDGALQTGPAASEDVAVVGTADGLTALSLVNGALLWTAKVGAVGGRLAIDAAGVAATTATGEVVLLDWCGRETRRFTGATPGFPPMLCGSKILYCAAGGPGSGGPGIQIADPATGASARWLKTDWLGAVTAPPVFADGRLFFGTEHKGLVCARGKK